MAEFPKLPLWTDALIGDTFHLTPAEFGAYMRLLIVAWRRKDCALPADDVFMGRCVGDPKNWHRIKPKIIGFFQLSGDGFYRQMRLLDERESCARYAENAAARGKASALKRKNRGVDGLKTVSKQEPTPNPNPYPKEESTPLSPPKGGNPEANNPEIPESSKRKRRTSIPDNFPDATKIEEGRQFWAVHARLDLANEAEEQAEHFRDHHRSRGSTMADWPAAWRTWTRNALKFNGKGNVNGRHKPTAHDDFIAGLADFAGYTVGDAADNARGNGGNPRGHVIDLPSKSVKPRPS